MLIQGLEREGLVLMAELEDEVVMLGPTILPMTLGIKPLSAQCMALQIKLVCSNMLELGNLVNKLAYL